MKEEKKSILLRLSPSLYQKIAAWAEEDFRSVNGQIEYLLSECASKKYPQKSSSKEPTNPS